MEEIGITRRIDLNDPGFMTILQKVLSEEPKC